MEIPVIISSLLLLILIGVIVHSSIKTEKAIKTKSELELLRMTVENQKSTIMHLNNRLEMLGLISGEDSHDP